MVSDHLNSLDVSDLANWVLSGKKLELTIGCKTWIPKTQTKTAF